MPSLIRRRKSKKQRAAELATETAKKALKWRAAAFVLRRAPVIGGLALAGTVAAKLLRKQRSGAGQPASAHTPTPPSGGTSVPPTGAPHATSNGGATGPVESTSGAA